MALSSGTFEQFHDNDKSVKIQNSRDSLSKIVNNPVVGSIRSNKITAIRLANLIEQDNPRLCDLINYNINKLYGHSIKNDSDSKNEYFKSLKTSKTIRIVSILEKGSKVTIHFEVHDGHNKSLHFHIYRFNHQGHLIEAWLNV